MFNFIPPTAQSANKRAEFDELRRRINGRPQSFHGHNIQAIPATVVILPKTNQPLCSSFSDDAIIEHTSSYIVRQSRHWPDSIVNCFNRDDITELKPLVDATSESQGNQSFRGIVGFTIKSRDIMPHDQVVAHRFRVDMYRSNNDGTEHVVDLKVHVPEHCCSEDNGVDHNITPIVSAQLITNTPLSHPKKIVLYSLILMSFVPCLQSRKQYSKTIVKYSGPYKLSHPLNVTKSTITLATKDCAYLTTTRL